MSNIIKKESLPLETRIRFGLGDVKRLSEKLESLDKQMDRINNDQTLRDLIVEDLADTVTKYSKATQEVRSNLESYFLNEKTKGLPINLMFRRVYKHLTKA